MRGRGGLYKNGEMQMNSVGAVAVKERREAKWEGVSNKQE